MKPKNSILLLFVILIQLNLTIFTPFINEKASERKVNVQKYRDRVDLCELLNWESFNLENDLIALDLFVAEMLNDKLMTENEVNNILIKFINEIFSKVSETRGRSDIDESILFKDNTEILIERHINDLFFEDTFSYNQTFALLVNKYGEERYPFMLQFDTKLMTDLIDDYDDRFIKPLERSLMFFTFATGFLITSAAILSLGYEKDKDENHPNITSKKEYRPIENNESEGGRKNWKEKLKIDFRFFISLTTTVTSIIIIILGIFNLGF